MTAGTFISRPDADEASRELRRHMMANARLLLLAEDGASQAEVVLAKRVLKAAASGDGSALESLLAEPEVSRLFAKGILGLGSTR